MFQETGYFKTSKLLNFKYLVPTKFTRWRVTSIKSEFSCLVIVTNDNRQLQPNTNMSTEEDPELRDLIAKSLENNGVLGKLRVIKKYLTCKS